jgi:hypothetical protein
MFATSRYLSFYEFALFGPALAPIALGGSLLTSAIGAGMSAGGSLAAGANAQQMGQFQQQEYQQQGDSAVATAQRSMLEQQRQTKVVQSQLQARAAGDGGSATSGSVLNVSSQIAGRGEYNSLMDLSQGQNQAAGLTNMGDAALYQGNLANAMSKYSAAGSIAGGAGSMFSTLSRFGSGGGGFGGGIGFNNPGGGYY